jgi:hypothetical protein
VADDVLGDASLAAGADHELEARDEADDTGPFTEFDDGEDLGETAEIESWADVMADDGDMPQTAESAWVEPPAADDAPVDPDPVPAAEPIPDAEEHASPAIPEIAEPDLDWVADDDRPSEVESWADLSDTESEPSHAPAAQESALEDAQDDGVTVDEPPPIIPDTLARFDRTSPEETDDEAAAVEPVDVPLPTVTLARLALEQGDPRLAEATLAGVLERDSENHEAAELLAELRSGPSVGADDATAAKVAALRGWLDTIRLASERHST